MHAYFVAYVAIVFFLLTPGVLLRLPKRSTKLVVALTHGVLFVAVLYFTKKVVLRAMHGMGCMYDGFQDMPPTAEQLAAMAKPDMPAMPPQAESPIPAQAESPIPAVAQAMPKAAVPQAMKPAAPAAGPSSLGLAPVNLSLVSTGTSQPGASCSGGSECVRGICLNNRCL